MAPSLWDEAFDALSEEDQKDLRYTRAETRFQPSQVVEVVEIKKEECVKKQWAYTNRMGQKVLVRDVLNKVVDWLEKFKQVGDAAVQFDPGHAAIPWMAVRTLLQVSSKSCID
jgi:hypothetical protein